MTADLEKKYCVILLSAWFFASACSLVWNMYDDKRERHALALQSARAYFAQINDLRSWNAERGGVYVPITEKDQPNPYLHGTDRDLTTTSGATLTKINPAYMTRQISEIAASQNRVRFHITSLNPIRPGNKPFSWEVDWLYGFNRGIKESSAFVQSPDGEIFRYMAPMVTKGECLGCHAKQGYKLGDIRGGISLSMPMTSSRPGWIMIASHLAAMAAGTLLILFFNTKLGTGRKKLLAMNSNLQQEITVRTKAQQALQEARQHLEERVTERTLELSMANQELNRKFHQKAHLEKALTMIYDEFYQLFNSAPDGMLVIDRHYEILRANRAFTRLCNCSINDIIGRKCYITFKGSTCRTDQCPLRHILNGEKRFEAEADKVLTDNGILPCIVTSTPFFETDGTLIGGIMVVKDITERKQRERGLERSKKMLEESNRALQDFTHIISHDLQEPLMLIQTFSRRLRTKGAEGMTDQCKSYLEHINGAAGRMNDLINGLLLYSQVSSRGKPFVLVNLTDILNNVLDDLALRIEETGAGIEAEELPVIDADPLQIHQLFQNLIGNSLKYRKKETIPKIRITWKEEKTEASGAKFIKIYFRDNGIGFATESRERIFDIFERLDPGRQAADGTGLGLTICRKIVQRHHGGITADSSPGEGAEFIILLPVSQSTPTA